MKTLKLLPKIKTPLQSYQFLVKKLDRIYSKFIRKGASDKNGVVRCVTCGRYMDWYSEAECGHYIGRQHMATRWDHRNTHPQCATCNGFNEGEKEAYALFIEKTYGRKVLEELRLKKRMVQKWSTFDLTTMVKEYEDKFNSL